jgi:thiaminase/transcriptional activator TenA
LSAEFITELEKFQHKMATDKLLQDKEMKDLWEMAVEHPFIKEMTTGKLEHGKFRDYIIQDKLFCHTLRALVCSILADFTDSADFEEFHDLISELRGYRKEAELFNEMFGSLQITKADMRAHPTTEAFINFVLRTSTSGSVEDKLIVLYAIEGTYMDWAERAKKLGNVPSDKVFSKWMSIHLADNLEKLVNWVKNKLNEKLGSKGERLTHHHHFLMKRALQYEVMFWDTAFKPGSSVFPGEFGLSRPGAVVGK